MHRYVAGTLGPDELERFEIHLLECPACRRAVEEGAVVRAALLRGAARRRRRPAALVWAAPLAAAAALALWLSLPSGESIRDLGRVEDVPGFTGLAVRADAGGAPALADQGMAAYQEGDYGGAAELLAAASEVDPSPGLFFFLGIARLKSGSPEGAIESLAAALDPPGNPYAAEARFFLAKSWLRLGNADSALAHLAAVPSSAGSIHAHATALTDSVLAALER